MISVKLYPPPPNKHFLTNLKINDRKSWGGVMYLFQSLARALATNEDTFRIIYKNIPSAIEQGIFKVEYEWDDETMYAKFMIWSPSENMYKIPDDTCKIEDSIIESMIAYHFSTN